MLRSVRFPRVPLSVSYQTKLVTIRTIASVSQTTTTPNNTNSSPDDVTDFGSYWRRETVEPIDDSIASKSPSLLALHARLNLDRFNVSFPALARTLICNSAQSGTVNNLSMASFGKNLLNYYVYEHLMTVYPRLPASVLTQTAELYLSDKALSDVASQWGVEEDTRSALARYLEEADEKADTDPNTTKSVFKSLGKLRYSPSAIKREDGVIELVGGTGEAQRGAIGARATFIRALISAIYAETSSTSGLDATRQFVHSHIIRPKKLDLSSMLIFDQPTRELSRLCAREGIASPISRLLVETGRLSSHPLFVVGVFSGSEKLGEGQGASLAEAKTRAAVMALKSWYLYSPLDAEKKLPSLADTEEKANGYSGAYVDKGSVIV